MVSIWSEFGQSSGPGAVVCWRPETHGPLVGFGVLGVLAHSVSILSLVLYITHRYPVHILGGRGVLLVRRFRCLFNRFRRERYYYGAIYIVRGTLVCLVPVNFAGVSMVQVVAMTAILLLFAGLLCRLWPWRTEVANYTDVDITFGLVNVMTGAAFLVEVYTFDPPKSHPGTGQM